MCGWLDYEQALEEAKQFDSVMARDGLGSDLLSFEPNRVEAEAPSGLCKDCFGDLRARLLYLAPLEPSK